MSKRKWIILLIVAVIMFSLGCIMVWMLKPVKVVKEQDPVAIQEARMEQYRADSIKYTKTMSAMADARKKLDSMYSLKEKSNEILWQNLKIEMARIQSMPPDSINLLFTELTNECPPGW